MHTSLSYFILPNRVDKGVVKRGGFNKICSLSPQLQEFVGEPEMARTELLDMHFISTKLECALNENEKKGRSYKTALSSRSAKVDKEVKKRGGGGFTKLCSLSPELQKFTGVPELARTEVVKKLWSYIRENNLQDPNNKREIICDESLRTLFDVDSINMFQMNKALSKHILPLNGEAPDNGSQKDKQSEQEHEKGSL
ncbi:hypothetical protein Pyn_28352 [Prunus yedoensis var. nudiflora]|uniref:DM2 domain-containing protein n=1 Tax=Prunus yedoensis var. nudiflora TaxID=2094558 RepID=A0A314Y4E5_PRUYE|nr:hypothetical protein Pyn_28352 [Prunus yedoensis var. nudiflora]